MSRRCTRGKEPGGWPWHGGYATSRSSNSSDMRSPYRYALYGLRWWRIWCGAGYLQPRRRRGATTTCRQPCKGLLQVTGLAWRSCFSQATGRSGRPASRSSGDSAGSDMPTRLRAGSGPGRIERRVGRRPRGVSDLTPGSIGSWRALERVIRGASPVHGRISHEPAQFGAVVHAKVRNAGEDQEGLPEQGAAQASFGRRRAACTLDTNGATPWRIGRLEPGGCHRVPAANPRSPAIVLGRALVAERCLAALAHVLQDLEGGLGVLLDLRAQVDGLVF